MPRDIQERVPQGSALLSQIVQYIYSYIYDTPKSSGVYLELFADATCIYAIYRKEAYVLRKLQQGLSATEMRCQSWNITIN
jgi:hypothetical protein